jgi:hypothetical protein
MPACFAVVGAPSVALTHPHGPSLHAFRPTCQHGIDGFLDRPNRGLNTELSRYGAIPGFLGLPHEVICPIGPGLMDTGSREIPSDDSCTHCGGQMERPGIRADDRVAAAQNLRKFRKRGAAGGIP